LASVLVTGGAGFIGSHVVDALIDAGHDVSVIDNLATGRRENVNERATFYEVDLRDAERTRQVVEETDPDVVHHLAAQAGVRQSVADPLYDAECNIIGSLNLIQACRSSGVKRLIYASSGGAVYGEPEELPVKESAPAQPLSPYGVSKYAVECYLRAAREAWGFQYVVLRYANVYGPRQDPLGEAGVIAIFTSTMLKGDTPHVFGDGEQTRDYVYVKDVVGANLAAMNGPALQTYNVGTGIETSVCKLFEDLALTIGFTQQPIHDDPRPGEVRRTMVDASRLSEDTGWRPQYDLARGFQETVEWFRGRPSA
jgi:UDP-glucose 4-epimerase